MIRFSAVDRTMMTPALTKKADAVERAIDVRNKALLPFFRAGSVFVFSELTLQTLLNIWGGMRAKTEIEAANLMSLLKTTLISTSHTKDFQQLFNNLIEQARLNGATETQLSELQQKIDVYNSPELLAHFQQGAHHILEPTTAIAAGFIGAGIITAANVAYNWRHKTIEKQVTERLQKLERYALNKTA